jgi:sugar phosphate isomerase/epimerase
MLAPLLAWGILPVMATLNPLPVDGDRMIGGVNLSVQAWTFNRFTAFEAIEKARAAGVKNIELFPGQKMAPGDETGVGPGMGAERTAALKAKLEAEGIKALGFGVTGISKDEPEARQLFAWAKEMGIEVVNTESTDAIETIEKMVKEFDIKVGYHNHPGGPENPDYKVWNPAYVYDLVKDRDIRIGACADTGHWVRSGIKPMDALFTLKGRVVSSHLKDLNVFERGGHDVPFGTGVSEVASILAHFQSINVTGPVSIEYEHNWDANLPEVAQCVGFVRGRG